jgi:dTDP-4-amino-4,6-dideoxygalactose transaminase
MAARNSEIVSLYEKTFANTIGAYSAHAFWKGRVALYAILKALQIGPGDEVILPAFTCVVVPNAVRFIGAMPVYADISSNSYNIDPEDVVKHITPNTRALIIQHTFGIPADLQRLLKIARDYRLAVIEDCAHALGSTYNGQPLGTFGIAAFFSSQWSKPYTTGLGGIAVTFDAEMAERLEAILPDFSEPTSVRRNQLYLQYTLYQRLFSPHLYWLAIGVLQRLSQYGLFVGSSSRDELNGAMPSDTTWRMSTFQARAGLAQIRYLSQNLAHRHELTKIYSNHLQARSWRLATPPEHASTIYLRYPIRVANKWNLLREASNNQVELGSWFESVLHPIRKPLERFGYQQGQCLVAERTANEVVNLPTHFRVSRAEAQRIVEFVDQAAEHTSV